MVGGVCEMALFISMDTYFFIDIPNVYSTPVTMVCTEMDSTAPWRILHMPFAITNYAIFKLDVHFRQLAALLMFGKCNITKQLSYS